MLVAMALAYGVKANNDQTKRLGDLAVLQLEQTHEQSVLNGQNIAGLTEFLRCALLIVPEDRTQEAINACIEGATFAPEHPPPERTASPSFRRRAVFAPPSATPAPTQRPSPTATRRPTPRPTPKPTSSPTVCLQGTDICVAEQPR